MQGWKEGRKGWNGNGTNLRFFLNFGIKSRRKKLRILFRKFSNLRHGFENVDFSLSMQSITDKMH